MNNEDSKDKKIEVAKKYIDLQNQVIDQHHQIKKLNNQINEMVEDRRRFENRVKRTFWEIFKLIKKERGIVEANSKRIDDTQERLDKIEKTIDWIGKTLIGFFITSICGAIIAYLFQILF